MNHRWKHGPWKIVCINYESFDSISSSSNEGSMVQFILLCILRNKNKWYDLFCTRHRPSIEIHRLHGRDWFDSLIDSQTIFSDYSSHFLRFTKRRIKPKQRKSLWIHVRLIRKLNQLISRYKIIRYPSNLNPFKLNWPLLITQILCHKINQTFQSGKADDFKVLCRDGETFGVHLYCLFNSDFLYKQYKARQNFEGEGKRFNFKYLVLNGINLIG